MNRLLDFREKIGEDSLVLSYHNGMKHLHRPVELEKDVDFDVQFLYCIYAICDARGFEFYLTPILSLVVVFFFASSYEGRPSFHGNNEYLISMPNKMVA